MSEQYTFLKDSIDQVIRRIDKIEDHHEQVRKLVHDRLGIIHKEQIVRLDSYSDKMKTLDNRVATVEFFTKQNSNVNQELIETLKEIQKFYQAQQAKKEQRKAWLINSSILVTIFTGFAAVFKHLKFW